MRAVQQRVALETATAYLDLQLAQERRSVLEAERTTRTRQVQQVRNRFDLGDATRLEMLQADVALANLRPELLAAENAVRVSAARLNEALGRDAFAAVGALPPLDLSAELPVVPENEALLTLAVSRRPEFERYDRTRRRLIEAEGVSRADVLPEINARASVGITSFQFENLARPAFHNWTFGVNLRWTLFDGLRTASTIGRYRSQRRQSELDELAFRRRLGRELERARGTWQQAVETLDVAGLTVEQALEVRRVSEESFELGAVTFLEVTEAERMLRQAEFNRLQAYHGALASLAEIKTLVGLRPDAEDSALSPSSAPVSATGAAPSPR
jgi:outer membrane protein TolC